MESNRVFFVAHVGDCIPIIRMTHNDELFFRGCQVLKFVPGNDYNSNSVLGDSGARWGTQVICA